MRSLMAFAVAVFITWTALPLPAHAGAQDRKFACNVDGATFVLDNTDFAAMTRGGMTREKFAAEPPGSHLRMSVCDTRKLWRLVKAGRLDGCSLSHHRNWAPEYFSSHEGGVVFELMLKERNAVEFGGRKCS